MSQTPSDHETRAQQIARQIRAEIEAGARRHGDTLPSTRELAAEWGVSTFTINTAMRTLIEDGLVKGKSRSRREIHAPDQVATAATTPDRGRPTPSVLIVGGYAGSGKSELGRILARELRWPVLDKDTLSRPLLEKTLEVLGCSPHDRESETYLTVARPLEYEALLDTGVENVESGNGAILTAPFIGELQDPAWIDRTRARFLDLGAEVHLIWVSCDADSMRTYLRRRGAARDSAKLADWDGYLSRIRLPFHPAREPYHVIDNSVSSRPLRAQAGEFIATLPRDGTTQ